MLDSIYLENKTPVCRLLVNVHSGVLSSWSGFVVGFEIKRLWFNSRSARGCMMGSCTYPHVPGINIIWYQHMAYDGVWLNNINLALHYILRSSRAIREPRRCSSRGRASFYPNCVWMF